MLRDRSGAALLEFALVAPAFIATLIAILEIAFVYLVQGGLETSAEYAGRLMMTGQAQQAGMSSAQFRTAACTSLPAYMKCSNLYIDVQTISNFSDANTGSPTITYDKNGNITNSFSYSLSSQGQIVVVRLLYFAPIVTGPMGFGLANQPGNKRLLIATSVLKTESY